jgi:hypothetical protein
MKRRYGLLIVVFVLLSVAPAISSEVFCEQVKCNCTCPCGQYPIMRPDSETLQEWLECYNHAPRAHIDPGLEPPTGSLSLLSHLEYDPVERDQGSCGNCWVWGGTGVLEIALDVQEGIKDRLSIQYLNSKYNGGTGSDWACCGGWLEYLANFYASEGFVIPWSNTNAAWADGTQTCSDGTTVPWDTISTSPSYTITGCSVESITTHDVGSTTAINNIKNVLAQDKAIWFAFFLPTGDDWNQFFDFWNYESEDAIFNPDYSCGHVWDDDGGGHAVLCVGYNDEDPENAYWIMVNSWGTAYGGRPNGIFHLDMDMNYDCCSYDGPFTYDNFYWDTLDVTFDTAGSCEIGDLHVTWKDAALVLGTSEPYGPLLWGALIDDTVGTIDLAIALAGYGTPSSAFDVEVADWSGADFSWKLDSPSSVIAIGGTGVNLVSYEYNGYTHFTLGVTGDYVELTVDADGIDYIRLYFTPTQYVIHYSDSSEVQYDPDENDFAEAYAYYDSVNDKYVFLVMGICAEGTIGACRYLAANLASFPTDVANAQGIILHWYDVNWDGIAKADEMTVIATYP